MKIDIKENGLIRIYRKGDWRKYAMEDKMIRKLPNKNVYRIYYDPLYEMVADMRKGKDK